MGRLKPIYRMLGLPAACLLLSACVIRDLNQDMTELEDNCGIFKGQVSGGDSEANIFVSLINSEENVEMGMWRPQRSA